MAWCYFYSKEEVNFFQEENTMIKKTKAGIDINVKAYLKEVKGLYYVVLVYVNAAEKNVIKVSRQNCL